MKKVPEIRFNGFKGDWTVKLLDDIFRKVTDKNTDNALVETFTNSAQDGIVSQRDFFNHDISNSENIHGYYVVRPDDFVYNPRMSVTAPVGPINRNRLGRAGVMSPLYTVFKAKNSNYNLGFVEYFFKTDKWHSFMWKNGDNGARGDRFSIRDEILKLMPITLPPSNKEQSDISTFFDNLDEYISSQALELQKLKNIKKACLEKMFPKEGELVPEIRFDGFEGNWERTTLGRVMQNFKVSNELVKNNNLLSLSYGQIILKDIKGQNGLRPASYSTYHVIKPGILVLRLTDLQNDHKSLRVGLSNYTGIISPAYVCLETKEDIDSSFAYYLLTLYDSIYKKFYKMGNGLRQTLGFEELKELEIVFPKEKKEQEEISRFLSKLDSNIQLHSSRIDKLKQIRKGLLEKMFVANN